MDDILKQAMKNQPILNVGCIGHVANGKTSIVRDITNIATQKYSNEKKNGITVKLGYANAKIYKCPSCDPPECYQSTGSNTKNYNCKFCNSECQLVNHISFVDAPGHNTLMATMLNGTCVMDTTILVESAENSFPNKSGIPAPQTKDHMMITQLVGIPTSIVCFNKLDLVKKQMAYELVNKFRNYLNENNTNAPIIPMSASVGFNIDVLCEYLANVEIPKKDIESPFKMLIVRSFNVNSAGISIEDLKGGIIGGSLIRGMLKPNTDVLIYPGYISKTNNSWTYKPLKAKALSIASGDVQLDYAISGGLIGVQLDIDPALAGNDKLVGQIMIPDEESNMKVLKVFEEIYVKYDKIGDVNIEEYIDVDLLLNINANNINGKLEMENDLMKFKLDKPVCVELGDKITISKTTKSVDSTMKIIAYGNIVNGKNCSMI